MHRLPCYAPRGTRVRPSIDDGADHASPRGPGQSPIETLRPTAPLKKTYVRPVSFYSQHTRVVWWVLSVVLSLVLAVGWLARLVGRMRRAEQELIESQAQLRRAQRLELIGRLAGGIAHSRAADLARQLLALSRPHPLPKRTIDVTATARELERVLQRTVSEGTNLQVQLSSEPLWIDADRTRVEQVIVNLVINANDAVLATTKRTGEVRLSVAWAAAEPAVSARGENASPQHAS